MPATITLAVNSDSLSMWLLPALAAVDPPLAFDIRRADETRTADLRRDGSVVAAQTPPGSDELIEFDAPSTVDVPLFWQQWRLRSEPLERVAAAVHRCAKRVLH